MALYVLSERAHNHHIAWGVSYEFEDIIARTCNARILSPKKGTLQRLHRKWDIIFSRWLPYLKLPHLDLPREHNTLLLIAMGPGAITMLDTIERWRQRFDTVAAFAIDVYQPGIDRLASPKLRKFTDRLDHLFVSYEQSIPKVQEVSGAPVSLLLQGADVLTHGAHGGERPIDIISYGRRYPDVHKKLQQAFNYPQSPRIYMHSTFKFLDYPAAEDYREDRALFFQFLRRAKLSINYRYTQTTAWNARGVCPLTARWFESIAAGTAIVGSKPCGPEAAREFDWPDAVIDFPEPNDDPAGFVTNLLEDTERLQRISKRNYCEALRRHDWRYRLRDILTALKQPTPATLAAELEALSAKANALNIEPPARSRREIPPADSTGAASEPRQKTGSP